MELIELGSILEMTKGKKPLKCVDTQREGYLPYVDIEAFEEHNYKQFTDGEKCLPCEEGDILIVCDGSRSGLVGRAVKGYVGSTLAKISAKGMNSDYLFHFVQGKYALLNTRKKGTGTPHLNPEILKKQRLILPQEGEQKRIVSRIEELFSELDAGIDTLKKTKGLLAVYRQAVLAEAFSNANNNYITLGSIIEKPRYGTSKKCDYTREKNSFPVYRIPNIDISSGHVSKDDIKYAKFSDDELKGLDLKENDLLLIRSNGSVSLVGRTAIVGSEDIDATFAGYLIRIRLLETSNIAAKYLYYYLESHEARIYIENTAKSTSGVNNINAEEIKKMQLPWCSIEEQTRIVEEIDDRLSVCKRIEDTVEKALLQAEALRQSVLKDAYEGRL